MSEQKELLSFVLSEFRPLVEEHGFNDPVTVDEDWITRVDYLGDKLGLELELDWRDFAVFVLVVRLEDGKLPSGYYVSNGKKCRKHLLNVLQELGLSRQKPKLQQAKTKQAFERQAVHMKELLLPHVHQLLSVDENKLFA